VAADRGHAVVRACAALAVPAIVGLRAALATLRLPPIEQDLDPGGAFEPLRQMVEELRLSARDHHDEPAPPAHENDLNELS